jgi:hypothetical protein
MGCETRRADGRITVQTFLVKHHRNAEPRFFDEKFLDGVGEFRRLPGVLADASVARRAAGVARPADLANAVTFFERGLRLLKIKVAVCIEQLRGFLLPDAHHLRGFFLQRHARQQIFHAGGRGGGGIFVEGNFGGGLLVHVGSVKRRFG